MNAMKYTSRKVKKSRNKDVGLSSTKVTSTTPILCCPCEPSPSKSNNSSSSRRRQKKQWEDLPKTISIGTATTANSSTCYSSASVTTPVSSPPSINRGLCPVTGLYADINNDYYILPKIIGKGHYGIVHECIHRATRQVLAVKSIEKCKIGRLDHLQREIYLLANINHDHIMKMVDCYEDAECVHLITEKYTGGELFDKIIENASTNGCFSERKTASIIKSLLEPVPYLHDNDIVHRDIKPENILFENDQEDAAIKLIDFGLSRRHGKGEAPMSNPVGTAYYMSPELLNGKYDRSCDIWSIGIVTYILLAGYPPYNGATDEMIQESTRRGKLHFSDTWMYKSDDAMNFVKCLLRRDPKKRFTAKEALKHPWIRKNMSF